MSTNCKDIKKEACWTFSNFTAGNKSQIQSVIDANIIPSIICLLTNAEFEIKKEAAWAITNATSGGTPQQIDYLVRQGCIPPLCDILNCPESRIINVALEGIENILASGKKDPNGNPYLSVVDESGGVQKIIELQNLKNKVTFEKAYRITAGNNNQIQSVMDNYTSEKATRICTYNYMSLEASSEENSRIISELNQKLQSLENLNHEMLMSKDNEEVAQLSNFQHSRLAIFRYVKDNVYEAVNVFLIIGSPKDKQTQKVIYFPSLG
eukprot:gene3858-4458_t